jgi:hypothetical protein
MCTGADISRMWWRTPNLDRIARVFAESVADGDLEAAEGWAKIAAQYAPRERSNTGTVLAKMYRS